MLGPDRFRFMNVERRIETAADWNREDWPKLWLYNAHYFDDLAADGSETRAEWHRAMIKRWERENPPGHGNGWEPYPTSLRIVNWVKWALLGNALVPDALQSLATQSRWLSKRREYHLLGNHLWANAKALVFAGACFDGREADGWRGKGLALLKQELAEQILPDGGHFERSPMYHAILLEDVLDLLQLAQRYPGMVEGDTQSEWRDTAARMLRWLQVMSHPDGEIAFFNDAAFGVAPNLAALATYASTLGVAFDGGPLDSVMDLSSSGYVRLEAGPAALLADVARIGPDYLPGHAHADALSFELSIRGQRVFVNGGTSTYETGPERQRQRGTAMHNTVQVDGEDSSEVWAGFRVARRARPVGLSVERGPDGARLACAHDGYKRLPGRVVHRRTWRLDGRGLTVTDALEGSWREAIARFHLHPQASVEPGGAIVLPDGGRLMWSCEGGVASLLAGTWHREFGRSEANQCLEIRLTGRDLVTRFEWQ